MKIASDKSGEMVFLSGDEAASRGALEAGVEVVTGSPGTPSRGVIDSFIPQARDLEIYVEWSINEKVALDVAAAASLAGKRALVTMRMSGLNMASDALISLSQSGIRGGLVVYVGEDTGAYYGMVEQDSRYYSLIAAIPLIMPSSVEEAKEMTRMAFDLSEKIRSPAIILNTSVLAQTEGMVKLGEMKKIKSDVAIEKEISQSSKNISTWGASHHEEAMKRLKEAKEFDDSFNEMVIGKAKEGIIGGGLALRYAEEAIRRYNLDISMLKIGMINPLPKQKIISMLENHEKILVLEEVSPFIEAFVKETAYEIGSGTEIWGKTVEVLPETGDFNYEIVIAALEKMLNKKLLTPSPANEEKYLPPIERIINFCAGCPHRATYFSLRAALQRMKYETKEVITTGDIGCTAIGMNPPFEICWTDVWRGSSIGLAQGFKMAGVDKPVLATIGDGTFFQAGIQPLINAVQARLNITVVILDNRWMAMTGFQPDAGTGLNIYGEKIPSLEIDEIARACGVKFVRVLNPYYVRHFIRTIIKAIKYEGVSVIVAKGECALKAIPFLTTLCYVEKKKCVGVDTCEELCLYALACPAFEVEEGKVQINRGICFGCGLCKNSCRYHAIKRDWRTLRMGRL